MKIVFLTAGGPLGLRAVETLGQSHDILTIVFSGSTGGLLKRISGTGARVLGLGHQDPVRAWAGERDIRTTDVSSGSDPRLIRKLHRLQPDLVCIAGFRWLLSADVLSIPPAGTINLHPSLLPRHRGPNPLFWNYYHGDANAGITAHFANARADAGEIIVQEQIPLERGFPVRELYLALAELGGDVLGRAVAGVEDGSIDVIRQDDLLATRAPRVPDGTPMVDFLRWDAAQVWHFLRGMYPRFKEPFTDGDGAPIAYTGVGELDVGPHDQRPGTVDSVPGGWRLWCRNGSVVLDGIGAKEAPSGEPV